MYTNLESISKRNGPRFSLSFGLSKFKSNCQYKKGREFKIYNAYLNLLFTRADHLDIPVPDGENMLHQ